MSPDGAATGSVTDSSAPTGSVTDSSAPEPEDAVGIRQHRAHGIRAVFFDLDDTLFAHREAVAAAIITHLRELGRPYDATDAAAEIEAWRALEEFHYHRYLAGEVGYDEQRRLRARDFAARHGVRLPDADAMPWYDAYSARYVDSWRLHDDARACLGALREGIPGVRFGIITNGELGNQLHKIGAVGLSDEVDAVIASADVGVTKPDARIFELACRRLDVAAVEAVYVGDRLTTDAIGAARAGLTGVWIDRHGAEVSSEALAVADALGVLRITSLNELPPALAAAAR